MVCHLFIMLNKTSNAKLLSIDSTARMAFSLHVYFFCEWNLDDHVYKILVCPEKYWFLCENYGNYRISIFDCLCLVTCTSQCQGQVLELC